MDNEGGDGKDVTESASSSNWTKSQFSEIIGFLVKKLESGDKIRSLTSDFKTFKKTHLDFQESQQEMARKFRKTIFHHQKEIDKAYFPRLLYFYRVPIPKKQRIEGGKYELDEKRLIRWFLSKDVKLGDYSSHDTGALADGSDRDACTSSSLASTSSDQILQEEMTKPGGGTCVQFQKQRTNNADHPGNRSTLVSRKTTNLEKSNKRSFQDLDKIMAIIHRNHSVSHDSTESMRDQTPSQPVKKKPASSTVGVQFDRTETVIADNGVKLSASEILKTLNSNLRSWEMNDDEKALGVEEKMKMILGGADQFLERKVLIDKVVDTMEFSLELLAKQDTTSDQLPGTIQIETVLRALKMVVCDLKEHFVEFPRLKSVNDEILNALRSLEVLKMRILHEDVAQVLEYWVMALFPTHSVVSC